MINLNNIDTEKRNDKSLNLDLMSPIEIAKIMNDNDMMVASAIEEKIDDISKVIELCGTTLQNRGRIFYIGAGTSGRLGVLDAAECRPTFGVDDNTVIGIIAGGKEALLSAIEGAEDDETLAKIDLTKHSITKNDVVIGIAASGRTPYVIGGLKFANELGCKTVSISITSNSEIGKYVNHNIEVVVGPEILTGSTRLKAGSAQKMILNMISTGAMVLNGKVYKNLMVDVEQTNLKLIERAKKIVMDATECDYKMAEDKLEEAKNNAKLAITMILNNMNYLEATKLLEKQNGFIRKDLNEK